jgi:tetratricopeptide (TPR) repeat protein
MRKHLTLSAVALGLTLSLAGCQSSEERAEEHYQSALALIAEGDYDRAVVELRNVFKLDGSHLEARRLLAQVLLEQRGSPQQAYSQYLRLVEQYPDDIEARIALAEIAFSVGNWDEFVRHAREAVRIAPEDLRVAELAVGLDYHAATTANDASARRVAATKAAELLPKNDDSVLLRNIVIDDLLREGEFIKALAEIDRLLVADPKNRLYNQQRLSVMAELGDNAGIEAQLRAMIERFPDDVTQKATLLRFYISRNDLDKSEAFLRELAAAAPAGETGPRVDLIRFLADFRGTDAARAEIARTITEQPDPTPYRVLEAGIDFTAGAHDKAIATLETVLTGAEPTPETRNIKVALAQMLLATGNEVGARARVEEVLAEDPTHPEALKMRAAWLIQADDTDGAVAALRTALDQKSEDAQAMTLMAQAHIRAGRPELAREFLALAVEASGNAAPETVRYARLLMEEKSYLPAEDILLKALRLAPENGELLLTLGQLYLLMDDFARAQQVADTLRRQETPEARAAADGIEAERINRQSGQDEAMAFLENLAQGTDATLASRLALLRARIGTGDHAGALEIAQELAAANAEIPEIRFVLGATQALNGNLAEAEALYRALVTEDPTRAKVWLELSRIKQRQGDRAAAVAVIDEALGHMPDNAELQLVKAGFLEQDGDIDGAIAIHQALYDRDSSALIVANNLASLLATWREDPDSLERAWVVARRFRDVEIPAVQDTYGWILHRRGETAEALPYLEAAAKGLPEDAIVQAHLAEAYLALGRRDEALAQFQHALETAGPQDSRPQISAARTRLQELMQAPQPTAPEQN